MRTAEQINNLKQIEAEHTILKEQARDRGDTKTELYHAEHAEIARREWMELKGIE